MNYAEKLGAEFRLKTNLAEWMHNHGEVLSDKEKSNAYAGVRVRKIRWRGNIYTVVDVDGATCRIEKK